MKPLIKIRIVTMTLICLAFIKPSEGFNEPNDRPKQEEKRPNIILLAVSYTHLTLPTKVYV